MENLNRLKIILQLKGYSENTIRTYLGLLTVFMETCMLKMDQLSRASEKELLPVLINHMNKKKYGYTSQKQLIAAIKILYKEIYRTKLSLSNIYPTRRPYELPTVLSKREVSQLLDNTGNLKHKSMLSTIYALGLRSGELIRLRPEHIDSERMMVSIISGKGKKDRVVMLSPKLLNLLREYFLMYKPKKYLFEGRKQNLYSSSSLQKVFLLAKRRAGIKKNATLHTLRHSFATHLLENGTDIRIIQKLLGHTNINTTLVYTKVSNKIITQVRSPLEDL